MTTEIQELTKEVKSPIDFGTEVEVVMVRTPQRVEINLSKLTWGDVLQLQKLQRKAVDGDISEDAATEGLNSLISKVTGQKAEDMPAAVVQKVIEAISDASNGKSSPN